MIRNIFYLKEFRLIKFNFLEEGWFPQWQVIQYSSFDQAEGRIWLTFRSPTICLHWSSFFPQKERRRQDKSLMRTKIFSTSQASRRLVLTNSHKTEQTTFIATHGMAGWYWMFPLYKKLSKYKCTMYYGDHRQTLTTETRSCLANNKLYNETTKVREREKNKTFQTAF